MEPKQVSIEERAAQYMAVLVEVARKRSHLRNEYARQLHLLEVEEGRARRGLEEAVSAAAAESDE